MKQEIWKTDDGRHIFVLACLLTDWRYELRCGLLLRNGISLSWLLNNGWKRIE